MDGKMKMGWGPVRLIGLIYTLLGGLFTGLGVTFMLVLSGEERMIGVIFSAIGSVFLILGIVFLAVVGRKKRRMKALVEEGRFVWAQVVECTYNHSVRVNGRSGRQIVACYRAPDGKAHLFRSQSTFAPITRDLVGRSVKVYTDPERMKYYYVDIEPLLGSYVEH